MGPSDSEIKDQHDKAMQEAKEYARKLSIVVLSDKSNEKDKDKDETKLDLVGVEVVWESWIILEMLLLFIFHIFITYMTCYTFAAT